MKHSNSRRFMALVGMALAIIVLGIGRAEASEGDGPLIIDHACTDLSMIPAAWVDSAKTVMKIHYAHTSHGEQIPAGLNVIEAGLPQFSYAYADNTLPTETGALCIFNGQLVGTYITPHHYWVTQAAMNETRGTLTANPSINISMFVWCQEMDGYQDSWIYESVSAYLDSMSALEMEFPGVTFIYCTGNAQGIDYLGHNRWKNNERIRSFCLANEKVLYDFADLDAWWYDSDAGEWDKAFYVYEGDTVPVEHPQYYGDGAGHTSIVSCEQKAKAMWWLAMSLADWVEAPVTGVEDIPVARVLEQNFPNPFNPVTMIAFSLANPGHARLDIFDPAGRLVKTLVDGNLPAERHEISWNGIDGAGRPVSSGVYFYTIVTDGMRDTKKMILLR